MGKLSKFATTASLVLAVAGGVASADVSNTGPGSTNTQTNTSSNSVVCINNNIISGSNTSSQSSTSGNANSSGNTSSGGSSSGNASNSNSSNVSVSVNGSCPTGTTSAPANSPAAQAAGAGQTDLKFDKKGNLLQPAKGGAGGGTLPATGANDTVKAAVITVASLAAVAAVSQFGFSAYRRSLSR